MSALFVAAGPDIGKGKLDLVHNIDLAPTFDKILGVKPDATVEGKALKEILQ
jgi:arylsulfatase A-like enzyme